MTESRNVAIYSHDNATIIEAFLVHRKLVDGIRDITAEKSNRTAVKKLGESLNGRSLNEATDDDYLRYLSTRRSHPNSFNNQLTVLSKFRDFLGLPRLAVKRMKAPEHERIDIEKERALADAILDEAQGDSDRVVIILMSYGGLCIEDVCNVKRRNFTIHESWVQLDYTRLKTGVKASVTFIEKAGIITRYLCEHDFPQESHVFFSKTGKTAHHPLQASGVSNIVKRLSTRAGIRWHPHMFRHLAATELAVRGDNKFDLDNTFGWKHSTNTASIYVNLANSDTNNKHLERAGIKPKSKNGGLVKTCWKCHMPIGTGDRCENCNTLLNPRKAIIEEKRSKNDEIALLKAQMETMMKQMSDLLNGGLCHEPEDRKTARGDQDESNVPILDANLSITKKNLSTR